MKNQLENCTNTNAKFRNQLHFSNILAGVVTQSPNAIMLMDNEGNIQMINEGFSHMYEYTFEEFTRALGKNYRQTSFSSDVEYRLETVAKTKQPYRYEALNITKTGKEIWTQTALVPILDETGNVTHLVTIDTDIHERIIKSDQLVTEMEQLNVRIDNLARQFQSLENEFTSLFKNISELFRLVQQTGDILAFVNSISDETRILGFNASIEANRAGSHGTGFRVITNEIIEISTKTIQSISQIKQIVDSINDKQSELMLKRDDSESRMMVYHQLISILKKEVKEIEASIAEFKSLT
ncbi:MAG: methyl-accepting chemotaxis protein [Prolixibacteraceae bacterium]